MEWLSGSRLCRLGSFRSRSGRSLFGFVAAHDAVGEDQVEEPVCPTTIFATAEHVLRDERLHALAQLSRDFDPSEVFGTECLLLLLDHVRFRFTDELDLLRICLASLLGRVCRCFRTRTRRIRFARGFLGRGQCILLRNRQTTLCRNDFLLRVCESCLLRKHHTAFLSRLLNDVSGFVFLGDLTFRLSPQKLIRDDQITDEGVDRFDVAVLELLTNRNAGELLLRSALLKEIECARVLHGVAEVVTDDRFQDLGNQIVHVAESSDHHRRILTRDVNDLAHIERNLEAVLGTCTNRIQTFVQIVSFILRIGPVEHDARGRNRLDPVRVRVDGVPTRIHRVLPHAALAFRKQVGVLELRSGQILANFADECRDNTNVCQSDFGQGVHFDANEHGVVVVETREDHFFLQTFAATSIDERLSVLERIVARNDRARDFALARVERLARECRHDANRSVSDLHCVAECHSEQLGVDAVRARRNDADLGTALAATLQELSRILERIALYVLCDHSAAFQGCTIMRLNQTQLLLGDDQEWNDVDLVLPRPVAVFESRSERVSLVARFAVQRDDLAVGERLVRAEEDHLHVDQTHVVVGDDHDAEHAHPPLEAHDENQDRGDPPVGHSTLNELFHFSCFLRRRNETPYPQELLEGSEIVQHFAQNVNGLGGIKKSPFA